MKAIVVILLLAGVVSCPAQQGTQSALNVDDIKEGITAANAHNVQEAIRLLTEAIQLRSERVKDPALSATEKSNIYYLRGLAYFNRALVYRYVDDKCVGTQAGRLGNEDEIRAIADYGAAIVADPTNARAYRARGEVNWPDEKQIGDFTAALQLKTLDPKETAETYFDRGYAYTFSAPQKTAEAIADYSSALRVDRGYAAAFYERGKLYDEQGHRDLAIADYSSALPLVTSPPPLHFGIADAYYRRGKDEDQAGHYDLAITDLTAAISEPALGWRDLNDKIGDAYEARAQAEEHKAQYEEAIADYTKILDLNLMIGPGETAEIYRERGNDYAKLGQHKKANLDHAQALEIKHDQLCNQEGWEACTVDGK